MTETTHEQPTNLPAPPGGWLATRVANTVRYSIMNIFLLIGIAATAYGGFLTYTGLIFSFILIGYVDELFGDAGNKEAMPPVWYMQTQLFLTLPLLIFATLITFNVTSDTGGYSWLDATMRAVGFDPVAARDRTEFFWGTGAYVSLGLFYGTAGVNVAHELIHRTGKTIDIVVGRWLLAFTWDTGFAIEHVHGHHRYACTEQDPATARRGEYIIPFVVRSTVGQWLSAKRYEDDRLKRKGISNLPWTSRFWRGQLMTLAIAVFYVVFMGWFGVVLFVFSGAIGKIYLEVVNYIEHYGLVRIPGTRVESRHSWDSHRRVSGGMFYNLMLHANHHKIATRRFWELEQSPPEEAAVLPRGYMAMILFAFLGRPFFTYINKHLGRWDRELASPDEVAYLKGKGLYLGDLAAEVTSTVQSDR